MEEEGGGMEGRGSLNCAGPSQGILGGRLAAALLLLDWTIRASPGSWSNTLVWPGEVRDEGELLC